MAGQIAKKAEMEFGAGISAQRRLGLSSKLETVVNRNPKSPYLHLHVPGKDGLVHPWKDSQIKAAFGKLEIIGPDGIMGVFAEGRLCAKLPTNNAEADWFLKHEIYRNSQSLGLVLIKMDEKTTIMTKGKFGGFSVSQEFISAIGPLCTDSAWQSGRIFAQEADALALLDTHGYESPANGFNARLMLANLEKDGKRGIAGDLLLGISTSIPGVHSIGSGSELAEFYAAIDKAAKSAQRYLDGFLKSSAIMAGLSISAVRDWYPD